jgi:hypothetical protein
MCFQMGSQRIKYEFTTNEELVSSFISPRPIFSVRIESHEFRLRFPNFARSCWPSRGITSIRSKQPFPKHIYYLNRLSWTFNSSWMALSQRFDSHGAHPESNHDNYWSTLPPSHWVVLVELPRQKDSEGTDRKFGVNIHSPDNSRPTIRKTSRSTWKALEFTVSVLGAHGSTTKTSTWLSTPREWFRMK